MAVINRCAIAVAPREPMRAWTRPFQTREDMEGLGDEESLYLVPTFDDDKEAQRCLEHHCAAIFRAELELWCRDRSLWPEPLSAELFHRWFQVRLFPLVEDLAGLPLRSYDPEGCLFTSPDVAAS
ncbi:hypothetical protein NZK33_07585 [Cyanobium sp. FGCU-6]|jgi:hypothetical protein|nr:hypothetical protein [Cyanobium sp. FGCU6]